MGFRLDAGDCDNGLVFGLELRLGVFAVGV